jgi:hypothetical protein
VVAALPNASNSVAAASASLGAKGAVTAKTGLLGAGLVSLAPFIGIFAGFLAQLADVRSISSGRQRRIKIAQLVAFWLLVPGLACAGESTVMALRRHFAWSPEIYFTVRTGFWWLYALMLASGITLMYRRVAGVQLMGASLSQIPAARLTPTTPMGTLLNSLGMHLAMFLWLIFLAWQAGDRLAAGLVTAVVSLLMAWQFFSQRRTGVVDVRAPFGYVAICCALILLVINLRLDVWMSNLSGVSVVEIHHLYPLWLVPVLTLTLVLWIALLLVIPLRRQDPRAI